ncbi:sugar phosphate isomerase/epimerase [Candidatus Microgenomates bacterium]|nr:sugar phosphate isomerase/epimerase [Candidatus Microgenomates bacterium]MBI4098325.1 sugar phosphate isomerase/epimerase [Candidatus Levybacteria bacterium]
MLKSKEIKVSSSITDLPVFISLPDLFAGLKDAGAGGVEITPGFKSRWSFSKLKDVSDKFGLPITSVHQPPWSIAGFWFDEGFISEAHKVGVDNFVFHPPAGVSFESEKMSQFLQRLSDLQEKYGIYALLENMPWAVRPPLLRKYLPFPQDTTEPEKVAKTAKSFGLGMTFDTSHAFVANPQDQAWFSEIFPTIRNIHLSSFKENRDHLPLDMGDLNTVEFVSSLKEKDYAGLVTLEIYYPKKISYRNYDFDAIKRSVQLVKDS